MEYFVLLRVLERIQLISKSSKQRADDSDLLDEVLFNEINSLRKEYNQLRTVSADRFYGFFIHSFALKLKSEQAQA
ncbi:hypothetical protein EWB00_005583, partial [Schistosoma japonicum]